MRAAFKLVPCVRREYCLGCGFCGMMCPHGCLEAVDGIGVLVRPDVCTSEASCISACPHRALHMDWAPLDADRSIGQWRWASSPSRRAARAALAAN
jgi:NAD-dependent dihydropyrimidine dehydrogenase PreA subunit